MIGPLWGEKDEAKRIDGWKAVDRYIAENALVIPLLAICPADRLAAAGVDVVAACLGCAAAVPDDPRLRAPWSRPPGGSIPRHGLPHGQFSDGQNAVLHHSPDC